MLKKQTGFLEIVLLDMTVKFLRNPGCFKCASKGKYFFIFPFSNKGIGKKTLELNKKLTK